MLTELKFIIWGGGKWGRRTYLFLFHNKINVIGFIDSSDKKIGQIISGLPVVSFDDYKMHYSDALVVIAIYSDKDVQEVENKLIKNNITLFFNIKDCPVELMYSCIWEIPYKEIIPKEIWEKNSEIGIYGLNLFSILLLQYLIKENKNATILLTDNFSDKAQEIKQYFDNSKLLVTSEWKNNKYEYILDTCRNYDNKSDKYKPCTQKTITLHDIYIERFKNDRLKKFKGIHSTDARCFLIANGPSLRIADLDLLQRHKEITFGVNRSYKAFPFTAWRPKYYVATDTEMLRFYADELINLPIENKFLADTYEPFWGRNLPDNIYRFHLAYKDLYKSDPEFSDNAEIKVCAGFTVIYEVLQLAVYMGFKNIYIIGMDCSYIGDGREGKNHFIKGYIDCERVKESNPYILHTEIIFKACRKAKEYADAHGIKIYNATRGGKLEIFERVDFESLFASV